MKNILIVYEFDEDYIRRTLSFFKFFSIKENIPLNFYAKKWLEDKLSNETIFVDDNFNICIENIKNLDFFSFSIILSLNPEYENKNHKIISEFLKKYKINQLNPFFASFSASNKYKTIKKLKNLNIEAPDAILIEFKDRKNLRANLEKFINSKTTEGFYIQPIYGTEGRQTYFFMKKEIIENFDLLIETILNILPEQSVIIKEKKGNIYYFKEEERIKGFRDIVLRIFVFEWNRKIISHWCFVEVCPEDKKPVSSPLKGGVILNLYQVKENLYYKEGNNFKRFIFIEKYKEQVISEVKKIFRLFNKGLKEKLKIGGMDILLETDGKNLKTIFLELNPRPSGLDKLSSLLTDLQDKRIS